MHTPIRSDTMLWTDPLPQKSFEELATMKKSMQHSSDAPQDQPPSADISGSPFAGIFGGRSPKSTDDDTTYNGGSDYRSFPTMKRPPTTSYGNDADEDDANSGFYTESQPPKPTTWEEIRRRAAGGN